MASHWIFSSPSSGVEIAALVSGPWDQVGEWNGHAFFRQRGGDLTLWRTEQGPEGWVVTPEHAVDTAYGWAPPAADAADWFFPPKQGWHVPFENDSPVLLAFYEVREDVGKPRPPSTPPPPPAPLATAKEEFHEGAEAEGAEAGSYEPKPRGWRTGGGGWQPKGKAKGKGPSKGKGTGGKGKGSVIKAGLKQAAAGGGGGDGGDPGNVRRGGWFNRCQRLAELVLQERWAEATALAGEFYSGEGQY